VRTSNRTCGIGVILPLVDDARARLVALLPQAAVRGTRHLVDALTG
jgi:hypothetical protein